MSVKEMTATWRELVDLAGPEIVESDLAIERVEDWSRCRSPSRALRRMRMGHRQNVVIVEKPACYEIRLPGKHQIIMHPILHAKMMRQLQRRTEEYSDNLLRRSILGVQF